MAQKSVQDTMTKDELTGFIGAEDFTRLLRETLIPQSQENGYPLALILFDMDGLMALNEILGNELTDSLLKQIAEILTDTMPDTAVLCRYSGDEFAVVLPDTRLDDAFTLAEDLRRRIAALRLPESPQTPITISSGLAAYPSNGSNEVELRREADQALYMAKTTGRNKVALPLPDSRMITKTSHYTQIQLERLMQLAKAVKRNEASLLREALDDLLKKYNDRLKSASATHKE